MSLEEQSHTLEEKAADAMAVLLGFEALYQTDDDTYSNDDRDDGATSSTSSEGDSVFGLDILFPPGEQDMPELTLSSKDSGREEKIANIDGGEKETTGVEADASKRTVAWFHQQRVQKHNTSKVEIIMAVEEKAPTPPSKRMTSFFKRTNRIIDEGPKDSSLKDNQKQNPDPLLHVKLPRRRTVHKKKGWRLKGSTVRDSSKAFKDKSSPPCDSLEEEVAMRSGKTHRLTITLRKRRKLRDKGSSACCLFVDEVLDLSYFCLCLGEGVKEEGLRYTGFASTSSSDDDDDKNSVVENNVTISQEERTTYSF